MSAGDWVRKLESAWDATRLRRASTRPPAEFRIEAYLGHGSGDGVVLRGRVLDDPAPAAALEGEKIIAVVRRQLRRFATDELPNVPLGITVAGASVDVVTDEEGYFVARVQPRADELTTPWTNGTVELAGEYRGLIDAHVTTLEIRVPGPGAKYGIISDIDDTILVTDVQRVTQVIRQTFTRSALMRSSFPGTPELYRALEAGVNPLFYVSSGPWNLHSFVVAFLRHAEFPIGPVLLRDLLGNAAGPEQKGGRIREILDLHAPLRFVLIGDSGEADPQIYADIVRAYPGRILAVYIREVRLDPNDGRVEKVLREWPEDVPFVLAPDSDAFRQHATALGLL